MGKKRKKERFKALVGNRNAKGKTKMQGLVQYAKVQRPEPGKHHIPGILKKGRISHEESRWCWGGGECGKWYKGRGTQSLGHATKAGISDLQSS